LSTNDDLLVKTRGNSTIVDGLDLCGSDSAVEIRRLR
jgi:hypothetical protein